MIDHLEAGLFALASLLRLPVMILLWGCVGWSLYAIGDCLAEFLKRRRERGAFDLESWTRANASVASIDDLSDDTHPLPLPLKTLVERVRAAIEDRTPPYVVEVEYVLSELHDSIRHNVDASRVLVRVGPSLGLLGTLIPMSAALAALASGKLEVMSGQMVVAFSTTVIGLATGTIGFAISILKGRWASVDVRETRFIAEWLLDRLEKGDSA